MEDFRLSMLKKPMFYVYYGTISAAVIWGAPYISDLVAQVPTVGTIFGGFVATATGITIAIFVGGMAASKITKM